MYLCQYWLSEVSDCGLLPLNSKLEADVEMSSRFPTGEAYWGVVVIAY